MIIAVAALYLISGLTLGIHSAYFAKDKLGPEDLWLMVLGCMMLWPIFVGYAFFDLIFGEW